MDMRNASTITQLNVKDLQRHPLLNAEKEKELCIRLKNGDKKAREELITSNMRFIYSVAKKYANRGIEFEDLISEGYVGLIEAVDHFDINKGVKFISYAVWWIRHYMMKLIEDKARMIRLPANKLTQINNVLIAKNSLENIEFKTEEEELSEIALSLGMTKYHVREMLMLSNDVESLDAAIGENKNLHETLKSSEIDPCDYVEQKSLHDALESILAELGERDAEVIKLRYGLVDGEEKSLQYISERYNLSRERVRQIELHGLKLIRKSKKLNLISNYVA